MPNERTRTSFEHVDALIAAIEDIGGRPEKAPRLDFGDAFSDRASYLRLARPWKTRE